MYEILDSVRMHSAVQVCQCGCAVRIHVETMRNTDKAMKLDYYCPVCILRDVDNLKRERNALQKFKTFVHNYLDSRHVPNDPPGKHRDAGCRIGQRLQYVCDSRDEWRAFSQAMECERDALKRDNASLTERLAIVTQERDTAKADKDAHIRGGMFNAWANGNCDRHGRYQIAIEKGGAPAICCPECTRADLERERDSLKAAIDVWEANCRRWHSERDALQSRANCAEEELKQAQRKRDAHASPVNHPNASATDLHSVEYAEGFAAGRADGRRLDVDQAYNNGRDEAFEVIESSLCAWVRHMIRNYPA